MVGSAIIGLIGTAVGAVSDQSKEESEAKINAYMDSHKDLLASNQLTIIALGGMFSVAMIVTIVRSREK